MAKQIDIDGATFTYKGVEYVIDAEAMKDIETEEMREEGNHILSLRRTLGAAQWEKFKESARDESGRVSVDELLPFVEAIEKALTGKPGN